MGDRPDWLVTTGGGTRDVSVLVSAGPIIDLIPAPGAGFRLVLFTGHVGNAAAAGVQRMQLIETTPANVLVKTLFSEVLNFATAAFLDLAGYGCAPGNKVRFDPNGGPGWGNIVYSVVPV